MFANCQAGGMDIASADVCKTPPVAIPVAYTNIALGMMAIPNVSHIMFAGAPAHNMATIIPVTYGDEPGSQGGVCSGTIKGLSRHITGVSNVLLAGAPATKLTNLTTQNKDNTVGARLVPSQGSVAMMS